jgi:hypothetical protein
MTRCEHCGFAPLKYAELRRRHEQLLAATKAVHLQLWNADLQWSATRTESTPAQQLLVAIREAEEVEK